MRIIDTFKPQARDMSEPILSPDGKMMWSGKDWIPLPIQSNTSIQDSVVMGDINTQIEHSVHNTYTQDTEKMVRNHLHIVAEKMEQGHFVESDAVYQKAKEIDYQLATKLYNGEFCQSFVVALWNELASHDQLDLTSITDRLTRILEFDENHILSLLLLAETSLDPINVIGTKHERIQVAEIAYQKVLSLEPDNKEALHGIKITQKLKQYPWSNFRFYIFLSALTFIVLIMLK